MPSLAVFRSQRAAQNSSAAAPTSQGLDPSEQQAALIARGLAGSPEGTAQHDRYKALLDQYGPNISADILDKYGLPHPSGGNSGGILSGVMGGAMDLLDYVGRPAAAVRAAAQAGSELIAGGAGGDNPNSPRHGTGRGNVLSPFEEGYNAFTGYHDAPTFTQLIHQDKNAKPKGVFGWGTELAGATLTDPTTYLSFGAKPAAEQGLRAVAEEFGPNVAKSIAAGGTKAALDETGQQISRDALREALAKNAVAKGAQADKAAKGAERTLTALDTAPGGVRFAGKTIPGTRGLMPAKLVDPTETSIKEGAINSLRNIFRNNVQTETRFGKGVSGLVTEAESAGKGVTERLVSTANQQVTPALFKVSNQEVTGPLDSALKAWGQDSTSALAQRAVLSPEGKNAFDQLIDVQNQTKQLAKDTGIQLPDLATDKLTAPAIMDQYQNVARQAGFQHSVNSLTGIKDDLGRNITYTTDELLKEAGHAPNESALKTSLSGPTLSLKPAAPLSAGGATGQRIKDLAEAKGLTHVVSGDTELWVPKEISHDVAGTIKTFTTDAGSRAMKARVGQANQLWRAYSTVFPTGFGFFTRNGLGNVMNMFYAGVHPETFYQALKLTTKQNLENDASGLLTKAVSKVIPGASAPITDAERTLIEQATNHNILQSGYFMRETSGAAQEAERAMHGRGGVGIGKVVRKLPGGEAVADTSVGKLAGSAMHNVNPLNPENVALSFGRHVNTSIENNARLALFLDGMNKGMAPADAALRVKKYLFDYTNLSETERTAIKPWVAFYTFMRKNIPVQFSTLIHTPGKITAQVHALQAGQLGPLAGKEFDPNSGGIPSSAMELGGIPVGGHIISADLPLVSAADTLAPFAAAGKSLASGQAPDATELAKGITGPMSGVRSALTKGAFEAVSGKNFFNDANIKTNSDKWSQFFDELLPGKGKLELAAKRTAAVASGKDPTQALSLAFGLRSTAVNASTKLSEDYNRLSKIQQVITETGALPSLEDARLVGLVPTIKKGKGTKPDQILTLPAMTAQQQQDAVSKLVKITELRVTAKNNNQSVTQKDLQRLGLIHGKSSSKNRFLLGSSSGN